MSYKPHVFTRASSPTLFTVPKGANELYIDGPHRLTLRSEKGVRLADVNTEGSLRLWLPEERITIEERQGQRLVQREIGPHEKLALSALPVSPRAIAERGESPVFRALFSRPFGQSAVEQAASQPIEDDAFGVSKAEVDRWRAVLFERAKSEAASRTKDAWMVGLESAALVGAGLPMTIAPHDINSRATGILLMSAGVAFSAIAIPLYVAIKPKSARLYDELLKINTDSERERSLAVTRITTYLMESAQRERRVQLGWGIGDLVLSAGLGGLGALNYHGYTDKVLGVALCSLAGAFLIEGIYKLVTLPKKINSIESIGIEKAPAVTFSGSALHF